MASMIRVLLFFAANLLWFPSTLADILLTPEVSTQQCPPGDAGNVDCDAVQLLQMVARRAEVKVHATKCSTFPHDSYMDCGAGVPLCGTLVLETGKGSGNYDHSEPVVHGLWPETPSYGSSQCIPPDNPADATTVFSCYNTAGETEDDALWFQDHEWDKHGKCTGVKDVSDFFNQVCSLSAGPLKIMDAARAADMDLVDTANQLQRSGYCVYNTMSNSQIALSVCSSGDGIWKLADIEDFPAVCGSGEAPTPSPSPTPSPPPAPGPAGQCPPNEHGPACKTDEECRGFTDCVRCASSGYCTSQGLATGQCLPNQHGPACKTDEECLGFTDCVRCARSGYCTQVPL
jgi:hypothetical protein